MSDRKSQGAAYSDMRDLIDRGDTLPDPDTIPLDDVGPGMSYAREESSPAEQVAGIGGGKRDPRIDEAVRDGMLAMKRSQGSIVSTRIRCPRCYEGIGKLAPHMLMDSMTKKAHCPTCLTTYP